MQFIITLPLVRVFQKRAYTSAGLKPDFCTCHGMNRACFINEAEAPL